jgi:hypothetical protein
MRQRKPLLYLIKSFFCVFVLLLTAETVLQSFRPTDVRATLVHSDFTATSALPIIPSAASTKGSLGCFTEVIGLSNGYTSGTYYLVRHLSTHSSSVTVAPNTSGDCIARLERLDVFFSPRDQEDL